MLLVVILWREELRGFNFQIIVVWVLHSVSHSLLLSRLMLNWSMMKKGFFGYWLIRTHHILDIFIFFLNRSIYIFLWRLLLLSWRWLILSRRLNNIFTSTSWYSLLMASTFNKAHKFRLLIVICIFLSLS